MVLCWDEIGDKSMSEIIKKVLTQVEITIKPNLTCWAMLINGKLEEDMYGIGLINGVYYNDLDEIHNSLKESIECYLVDIIDDLPLNCSVDFLVTNMRHNEGQMSFPETGQWDFCPYIEMDLEIIKIDDYSGNE